MKNQSIAALTILSSFFCISINAQQTRFYSDPEEKFKEAKEYYQKEQYSLAYRQQKFADAAQRYEQANISNLSNREIADMKFHQGYAYFTLQRFNEAKPLFNSIRQIKDDPNYIDANYYYGFLAFRDKNYNEAL